jgi:hypothetical protein
VGSLPVVKATGRVPSLYPTKERLGETMENENGSDAEMTTGELIAIHKLQLLMVLSEAHELASLEATAYLSGSKRSVMESLEIVAKLEGICSLIEMLANDDWLFVPSGMVMTLDTMANNN